MGVRATRSLGSHLATGGSIVVAQQNSKVVRKRVPPSSRGSQVLEPSRIKAWSETVGILAVIGSLLFVGIEVRQNADATRAATAQSLTDAWAAWNLTMADPEAWSVVRRMLELEDFSDARLEDRAAARSLFKSLFSHWSGQHWQYLNGNLDQSLWDATYRNMQFDVARGGEWLRLLKWAWESDGYLFHEDFQALLGGMLTEHSDG